MNIFFYLFNNFKFPVHISKFPSNFAMAHPIYKNFKLNSRYTKYYILLLRKHFKVFRVTPLKYHFNIVITILRAIHFKILLYVLIFLTQMRYFPNTLYSYL